MVYYIFVGPLRALSEHNHSAPAHVCTALTIRVHLKCNDGMHKGLATREKYNDGAPRVNLWQWWYKCAREHHHCSPSAL
jgi:hypothetical protein